MKRLRLTISLVFFSLILLFGACAVNNPSSEQVVPAAKAAAMQYYIIAQTVRWLSLTNSSTPYKLSNFTVSIETNIKVETTASNTNATTNMVSIANIYINHQSDTEMNYNYDMDISYGLYSTYTNSATNMWFTTTTEANSALSNAVMVNLKYVKLHYVKGDVSMNTTLSNFLLTSKNDNIAFLTNQYIFLDLSVISNNVFYAKGSGLSKENPFNVNFRNDSVSLTLSGDSTNSVQKSTGALSGYLTTGGYEYYFQVSYDTNMNATFNSLQSYNGKLTFSMQNGE